MQLLIEGKELNSEEIREHISKMGESVLVVGDESLNRVHIHTQMPQSVIDYCCTKGKLKDIIQQDMDEQVAGFRSVNGYE